MKAIEFPQQTNILAKDQDEYNNLPVYISDDNKKQMISCHELDEEELKMIQETKTIWSSQLTFGGQYNPTWLAIQNPFIGEEPTTTKKENMSIAKVAANYGQILFFQWKISDCKNAKWNSGKGKVNARFLKDMEEGLIKNVSSKPHED